MCFFQPAIPTQFFTIPLKFSHDYITNKSYAAAIYSVLYLSISFLYKTSHFYKTRGPVQGESPAEGVINISS